MPAARYPARNAAWSIRKVRPRTLSSGGSMAAPTMAKSWPGFAFASVRVTSRMSGPTVRMRSQGCPTRAWMFGAQSAGEFETLTVSPTPRSAVAEARRELGAFRGNAGQLLVDVGPHDRGVHLAGKRGFPDQALIEHAAQRVHVGPAVHGLAQDLFGGDVVDRSHDLPGPGQVPL